VWYFVGRGNKSDADAVADSAATVDTTGWEPFALTEDIVMKYNPQTVAADEDTIGAKDGSWKLSFYGTITKDEYDGDIGELSYIKDEPGNQMVTKTIGNYTFTVFFGAFERDRNGGVYMTEIDVNGQINYMQFYVVLNKEDADLSAAEEILSTLTVTSGSDWADVPNSVTVPSGTVRLTTPLTKYAFCTDLTYDGVRHEYVTLRAAPAQDAEIVLTIQNSWIEKEGGERAKVTVCSEPVYDASQDIDRVLCHYTYGGEDVWGWAREDFLHDSYDAAGEALAAANQNATTTEPTTEAFDPAALKEPVETFAQKTGYVTEDGVSFRFGPSKEYSTQIGLSAGTAVAITAEENDFYYGYLSSYQIYGWISKSYIANTKPNQNNTSSTQSTPASQPASKESSAEPQTISTEKATEMQPTSVPSTVGRTSKTLVITDVGSMSGGRLFLTIDQSGWNSPFKRNNANVSVSVDGRSYTVPASIEAGSSHITVDLSNVEIEDGSRVTVSIPAEFLVTSDGTQYNSGTSASSNVYF